MKKFKPLVIKLAANRKYQRILKGPPQTVAFRSGLISLRPKEDIGQHSTENKEEALLILSGRAKISFDKYPPLKAGTNSLVYIPPHTIHNLRNTAKKILRYVYLVRPL